MAPEVMLGQKPTLASDIFSLAILLSEIASGQPPFPHLDNEPAVTHAVIQGERLALPAPASPGAFLVVELIQSMWAHGPEDRPQISEVFEKARASVWPSGLFVPFTTDLPLADSHGQFCRRFTDCCCCCC